jgi:hypothetical protein
VLVKGRMMGAKYTSEAVLLVSQDDKRTLAIANGYFYGSLIFIMCSAVLFAALPSAWFTAGMLDTLGREVRLFWPKLDHEAAVLNAIAPGRGSKYSIFILYCISTLAAGTILTLPIILRSMLSGGFGRLTSGEASAWWRAPVVLLFFVVLAILEAGFLGGDTKVGQAIAEGWGLWFWGAFLWWMLFGAFGTWIVFVVRRLKFGPAEK